MTAVDVRRSADRFVTRLPWLESRHSFSFGRHYAADNTGFGLLLVHNDDVVAAGAGFETHRHRDMEIVTWVLDGTLVHRDSTGHAGIVHPGLAQRMSAGTGILHSETNDSWRLHGGPAHAEPVHFVQMWVRPDEPGGAPGYEHRDVSAELAGGGLVPVAAGMPGQDAAIRIRQRDAALFAARLPGGRAVPLPAGPLVHVFVARGAVDVAGAGRLAAGDAVRLTDSDGPPVTALDPAEILVWQLRR